VSYAWAVTSGSAASLVSGANAASATVLAPATGSVRLQLTVTDDVGAIDSAEVTVGSSSASSTAPASITAAACPTAIVFAPKISLSATTLDFASLMIGASSSAQVVTIANTGNAGMQVSNVGITGADAAQFTQSSNCSSVAVGGSCTINVTFAPTSAGAKSATLAIAHNASGSPSSVALSGTANAPVSSGGGGGGGAFDPATLLLLAAAALLRGRRARKENTW
jgi:hypothetical protein